ncbi:hypothetical protein [uncultured Mediterranean phage uvMED]|nr:hypothetical protein [uncultured Mediterranean phage uvMED]
MKTKTNGGTLKEFTLYESAVIALWNGVEKNGYTNYPLVKETLNMNDVIYWLDINTDINTKYIDSNILKKEILDTIKEMEDQF